MHCRTSWRFCCYYYGCASDLVIVSVIVFVFVVALDLLQLRNQVVVVGAVVVEDECFAVPLP